ncbi:MAG: folate-binding protein [Actinomycetia bacterium]|nr:folate-binding protein [Actinomycetes bacterium]
MRAVGSAADDGAGVAGVAAHYGDPIAEQRALADGSALVDLSHRGVVTVTGPDRLTWLHSLTSQHLSQLAPGQSAESLVLSPKGHIEHALHIVDVAAVDEVAAESGGSGTTWITVEPGTAPAVVAWLDSMRFMLRVEVADVTTRYAVLATTADPLPDLGTAPVALWRDPWPAVQAGELVGDTAAYGIVAGHPGEGWRLRELIVPRDDLAGIARSESLTWAGVWALEALRIAAWRPRLGAETDHRTIAHELDWLRSAVHLHKGCYRGQETVARVHNLGRPPRRLVFLHLDGSGHDLPGADAPVRLGERVVGRLTSVARHYEDGPIALAVIKRNIPVDAELLVGGDGAGGGGGGAGGGDVGGDGAGDAGYVSAAQTVIVEP